MSNDETVTVILAAVLASLIAAVSLAAPALWRLVRAAGETGTPAWRQPLGAHDAYRKGDRVTHAGTTWQSTIDANVWAPGVYGWTQL